MSHKNASERNQSGTSSSTLGNTTSGTSTSTITPIQFLPFMVGLNIPYFNQIINNPLLHSPSFQVRPTKIPFDIPKFEGNIREDPTNHVHSFHMCCSSNSITDESIHFCSFQFILTGVEAKCYVDQPLASHSTFLNIAKYFLPYF